MSRGGSNIDGKTRSRAQLVGAEKKTQVQTHNSKPCVFMMMYCGEIPTSLTVSAKPAKRGDGVGDDIREFEC